MVMAVRCGGQAPRHDEIRRNLRNMIRFFIHGSIYTFWILGLVGGLVARNFDAEGTITYSNFNDGKSNFISRCKFTIYVADPQYSLRIVPPTNSVFDYREIVYDGTNLFLIESFESTMPERIQKFKIKGDGGRIKPNIATATISRGPILHNGVVHDTGPIWLALASGWYFASRTNNTIESVLSFDFPGIVTPDTLRFQKAEWLCQSEFPYLPEKVIFFDSGKLPNGDPHFLLPYRVGYTSAVYEVKEFKNFDGTLFPKTGLLQLYYPKRGGKVNTDLRLAALYEVNLENAKFASDRTIVAPSMPGATYVMDYRFAETAGKLTFRGATGWPSEEVVKSSKEYKNGLQIPRSVPKR